MPNYPEYRLQCTCVLWAQYNEGRWPELRLLHHSPNGGSNRGALTATHFKRMGVRPGFPDLLLPVARCGCTGLAVELKADKGRLTGHQAEYLGMLQKEGWRVAIIREVDEFIETVEGYLK